MQTSVDLKLLHTNPRGWVSKRAAILDVINSMQPDYVNINEEEKIKSILKATTVFQRIGWKWQEVEFFAQWSVA